LKGEKSDNKKKWGSTSGILLGKKKNISPVIKPKRETGEGEHRTQGGIIAG